MNKQMLFNIPWKESLEKKLKGEIRELIITQRPIPKEIELGDGIKAIREGGKWGFWRKEG
jgi:hypothetical protein